MRKATFTIRPGTVEDSLTVFTLFEETWADLSRRHGHDEPTSFSDPEAMSRMWKERRSLYNHLATSAAEFWLAEEGGYPIGFSRSIIRGDVQTLTEFFVRPNRQSSGVGKALLDCAFSRSDLPYRSILATLEPNAQSLYLRTGVYPRFPVYYFGRKPKTMAMDTDLTFIPIIPTVEQLAEMGILDEEIVGFRRDQDHQWLASDRQGFLYERRGQTVGYGYMGKTNGPFLMIDPADFPAVLAHAENLAVLQNRNHFGLEVPMINLSVVNYVLDQKFIMDPFITIMMNNAPYGDYSRYIITSPPFLV